MFESITMKTDNVKQCAERLVARFKKTHGYAECVKWSPVIIRGCVYYTFTIKCGYLV